MRAKLERIAAGKIEYEKPKMSLSESLITLNCRPGEKAESSFTVTADRQIKGIVYASSWRMQKLYFTSLSVLYEDHTGTPRNT